jgi:hypothetical protein
MVYGSENTRTPRSARKQKISSLPGRFSKIAHPCLFDNRGIRRGNIRAVVKAAAGGQNKPSSVRVNRNARVHVAVQRSTRAGCAVFSQPEESWQKTGNYGTLTRHDK